MRTVFCSWSRWLALLLVFICTTQARAVTVQDFPNLDFKGAADVYAVVRDPASGKIYVGGFFSEWNQAAVSNLARLNADGTLDTSWRPEPDGIVRSLALDGSGNLYVGGAFSNIGGQARMYLAKLTTGNTAQADPWWAPNPDGFAMSLQLDSAGSLYAAGPFTSIGGQAVRNLAKLSTTGTGLADANWAPNPNGSVDAIAIDEGNNIYAGGKFSQIGGQNLRYLAKLSGSGAGLAIATWAPNPNDWVAALATDGAGNLYAGGDFTNIGGQALRHLAKISTSAGTAYASWAPNPSTAVQRLLLDGSGGLFAARDTIEKFSTANGVADPAWTSPHFGSTAIFALANDGQGALIAGGMFYSLGGVVHIGIARVLASGMVDSNFKATPTSNSPGTGTPGVWAFARQTDGRWLLGGTFVVFAGGVPYINLVRMNVDGTLDTGWAPNPNSIVHTLALDGSGALYAGGSFSEAGGLRRSNLAKLSTGVSGVVDAAWAPDPDGPVFAVTAEASGVLYAGGLFRSIGGQDRSALAKLSTAGTGLADATWSANTDSGTVYALLLDGAGSIYAGGTFATVNGVARSNLAKILTAGSGTVDASWAPNPDGNVSALARDQSGLYVGGTFAAVGGQSRSRLARLSTADTGSADISWVPNPDGPVSAIAVDGLGSVYVGGHFTHAGGQARTNLTRLSASGSGAADVAWYPDPNGEIRALAVDGAGSVYVGGPFDNLGGRSRVAAASLSDVVLDIAASNGSIGYGESLTLSAQVTNGGTPATGSVTFNQDGAVIGSCTGLTLNGSGQASCVVSSLPPGSRKLTFRFVGSGAFAGVVATSSATSTTITKANSAATLTIPATSVAGRQLAATYSVARAAPGAGTPTGTVTVGYTGSMSGTLCSGTVASGSCSGLAPPAGSYTFTANYAGDGNFNGAVSAGTQHAVSASNNLTVARSGTGSGKVTSNPVGIDCGTSCSAPFLQGSNVDLSAAASAGSVFTGWSGACSGTGVCTVPMSSDRSVTATFSPSFNLSVTKSGSGAVTSSPTGINCGATCNAAFPANQVVTLTAAATAGYTFTGWSGACTGAAASCQVTMSQARSVNAVFAPGYALTVTKAGSGTITSSPQGISCGATCSYVYPAGQVVTLSIVKSPGYRFAGWSGACTGTATSCQVTMSQARSVTATFVTTAIKGDLNGDRKADLLWYSSSNGQAVAWLMNGLTRGSSATLQTNTAWKLMMSGDFNGDGKADLLWYNASLGATDMWIMNGLTRVSSARILTSLGWKPVLTGDLDGDGKTDIVWRNDSTGQTTAWLMNGTAQVGSKTLLTNAAWKPVAIGDLNGDGKDDILWNAAATGQTAAWLMNGLNIASSAVLQTNTAWMPMFMGDLDGDGKADILWYNASLAATDGWLMNGLGVRATARLLTAVGWKPAGIEDVDGNGKSDIIFRNGVNGETDVWLMNGLTRSSYQVELTSTAWVPISP